MEPSTGSLYSNSSALATFDTSERIPFTILYDKRHKIIKRNINIDLGKIKNLFLTTVYRNMKYIYYRLTAAYSFMTLD